MMELHNDLAQPRGAAILQVVLGLAILVGVAHWFRVYWRLRHIPGPLLAKFTDWQRVSWVNTKRAHDIHQELHEKYGEVVQFGPNMVSLANPEWIPVLYPIRPGFPKSNFYRTLMPYTRKGGALPVVFNTRDEALHKKIKSPIAPLFSLSNVLTLEGFVNNTLSILIQQFDKRFVGSQEVFDLADWLQYFAFDVMGTLTFSKRYGLLEQGRDVQDILSTVWIYQSRAAPMTQIPWFDEVWKKNRFMAMFQKTTGFSILSIVGKFIAERQEAQKTKNSADKEVGDRDMLSHFFETVATNESLPPWCITAWTFSNVMAGSDSTAVVMRTVWYHLLANPKTLERLREELRQAEDQKPEGFSKPFPSWKDVCDLPYLDACILEAVRLHPPFCLPFERVVPKGGVTIGEQYFSEGTVIGMNPWVINRHKPTFGDDAEEWNPDRWMVPEDRKRKLESNVLTVSYSFPLRMIRLANGKRLFREQFGAGRRVCLGRHVAMLELKKLVPALLQNYDFELIDPKRYKVENSWFFRQYGMDVRIKKRPEAVVSV